MTCVPNDPDVTYNRRPSPTSFTFSREGDADLRYGREFECNLDGGIWDGRALQASLATELSNRRVTALLPTDSKIYRSDSEYFYYPLEVLAPLSGILDYLVALDRDEVQAGQSFIATIALTNRVGFDINLRDFSISGDRVAGRSICGFSQTPSRVRAGRSADIILTCTVPSGAQPQTISGIEVFFTTDRQHPCSDDGSMTIPIPSVDVVLPPQPSCTNGADDDGDDKVDCLDDDGPENCCSDPACPYDDNSNSEGANGKICCDDGEDNDGDDLVDADDSDCQVAPTERCDNNLDDDGDGKIDCDDEDCCQDTRSCPMYLTNEGANNHLCCHNGWDEDRDGDIDMDDLDCRAPWVHPCVNRMDDDADRMVDCLDFAGGWEVCCSYPACPYDDTPNSEGANDRRCCRNGLDDDGDGLTDREDPDCLVENCENGIDDDGDCWALNGGMGEDTNGDGTVCGTGDRNVDCLDTYCCAFSRCPYRTNEGANDKLCCSNRLDEDRDSKIDMADEQCFFAPETCDDSFDNDLDGLTDCDDPDCCMDPVACPAYAINEGANSGTCCANALDEDGDALIDCLDDDCCPAALACPVYTTNEGANGKICCSNTLDEDMDTLTDLADPDCIIAEICNDSIDNDMDGLVDCNDPDCCMDEACPMYATDEGANSYLCCDNTLDEDNDSLTDCFDDDCCPAPVCPYDDNTSSEALNGRLCCFNLLDEDNDMLTDLADPDCQVTEICDNGLDDDGDSLIDCDDPDCCMDPVACPDYATNEGANNFLCCDNGLDEDGGAADCQDTDCCPAANCPYDDDPSSEGANGKLCCGDGLDNDGDGLTDNQDPDCYGEPSEATCDDGLDNDADGFTDCDDSDCCTDPVCPYDDDPNSEGLNSMLCCSNSEDDDGDGLTDEDDPDCVSYDGSFNDMVKQGEIRTFSVEFKDNSTVAGATGIEWDFSISDSDYDGTPCLIRRTFSKTQDIPKDDGQYHQVTTLTLQTTTGGYCAVTVHALAPDDTTEIPGSYLLEAGDLPSIDPNVQIPEIPAVIHPINIYSSDPEDAEDSYSLAESAVNQLSVECGGDCGGNAVARNKLDDAIAHLAAAQRYLTGCQDGGPTLCRFSQYYSERANRLAREGSNLLD